MLKFIGLIFTELTLIELIFFGIFSFGLVIPSAHALVTPTIPQDLKLRATDPNEKCLDAERLAREFRYDFRDPDDKPVSLEPCDSAKTSYAVAKALIFLKDLPASHVPKSQFNPNKIEGEPYDFLASRVRKVIVDDRQTSDECADGRLAFTHSFWREQKKIWICPAFRKAGDLQATSVLLHEARHLDGQEFNHVACHEGRMKNQMSCDQDYESGSAYAIGLEYLVKLTMNPGLDPAVRSEARRLAVLEFVSRFNDLPLDLERGALVQNEKTGMVYFYNGQGFEDAGFSAPLDTVFSSLGGLANLYSPSSGKTAVFDFEEKLSRTTPNVLSRLFQGLPSARQRELRSVAYGKTDACLLLQNEMLCFDRNKAPYSLRTENSVRLLMAENSNLLESGALYSQSADFFLHRLPSDATSSHEKWPRSRDAFPFIGGGIWGSVWNREEIWLSTRGELQIFDQKKKTWRSTPQPTGPYRAILAPYVWSKRLQDL